MKQNKDCFVHSLNSHNSYNLSKIEQFMLKVQIAQDISKLKSIKQAVYPHFKHIVSMANDTFKLKKADNITHKLNRSV